MAVGCGRLRSRAVAGGPLAVAAVAGAPIVYFRFSTGQTHRRIISLLDSRPEPFGTATKPVGVLSIPLRQLTLATGVCCWCFTVTRRTV